MLGMIWQDLEQCLTTDYWYHLDWLIDLYSFPTLTAESAPCNMVSSLLLLTFTSFLCDLSVMRLHKT